LAPASFIYVICLGIGAKIQTQFPALDVAFVVVVVLFARVLDLQYQLRMNDFFDHQYYLALVVDHLHSKHNNCELRDLDQALSFVQYVMEGTYSEDKDATAMQCWSFLKDLCQRTVLTSDQAATVLHLMVSFLTKRFWVIENNPLKQCVSVVLIEVLKKATSANPTFQVSEQQRASMFLFLLRHPPGDSVVDPTLFRTKECQRSLVLAMGAPNFLYVKYYSLFSFVHMPVIEECAALKALFVTKLHEVLVHASVRKAQYNGFFMSKWLALVQHCSTPLVRVFIFTCLNTANIRVQCKMYFFPPFSLTRLAMTVMLPCLLLRIPCTKLLLDTFVTRISYRVLTLLGAGWLKTRSSVHSCCALVPTSKRSFCAHCFQPRSFHAQCCFARKKMYKKLFFFFFSSIAKTSQVKQQKNDGCMVLPKVHDCWSHNGVGCSVSRHGSDLFAGVGFHGDVCDGGYDFSCVVGPEVNQQGVAARAWVGYDLFGVCCKNNGCPPERCVCFCNLLVFSSV
jgi:hypothetical protein